MTSTATKGKTTFEQISDTELRMSRIFNAPRELVFKVCTDAKAIPNWWGPGYLTTTVETMDLRPGGKWRFVQQDPQGNVFAFNGEFREIVPPERLVETFEFEGAPGEIVVDTYVFEDLGDGRTKLTATSEFPSAEALQGMKQAGMEEGAAESWDRLAELVEKQ